MLTRPASLLLPLFCLGSAGCVAYAVPPVRAELTVGGSSSGRMLASTSLGTSTDAFLPRDTPLEAGAGFVIEYAGDGVEDGEEGETAEPIGRGAYLDVRRRSPCRNGKRASVGGRGELLVDPLSPNQLAVGGKLALRAAGETCLRLTGAFDVRDDNDPLESGDDVRSIGAGAGAFSLGFFAEAGVEVAPRGGAAVLLSGGLSLQLPAVAGLSFLE